MQSLTCFDDKIKEDPEAKAIYDQMAYHQHKLECLGMELFAIVARNRDLEQLAKQSFEAMAQMLEERKDELGGLMRKATEGIMETPESAPKTERK